MNKLFLFGGNGRDIIKSLDSKCFDSYKTWLDSYLSNIIPSSLISIPVARFGNECIANNCDEISVDGNSVSFTADPTSTVWICHRTRLNLGNWIIHEISYYIRWHLSIAFSWVRVRSSRVTFPSDRRCEILIRFMVICDFSILWYTVAECFW